MRRFATSHVPAVGEFVSLELEVSHHLLRVTGIAPGEQVELFDGTGVTAVAELCDVQEGCARLRVVAYREPEKGRTRLHLMVAQLRANSLDTVLRMSTELGVTDVTVIQSERCVARGDKRDRWVRIVRSAAAQSGRTEWPTIHPPCALEQVLSLPKDVVGVVCDPCATEVLERTIGSTRLLIGPEGGWTDQELAEASNAGWLMRGLGKGVLRADTAAVAAIARCLA